MDMRIRTYDCTPPVASVREGELELLSDQTSEVDGVANVLIGSFSRDCASRSTRFDHVRESRSRSRFRSNVAFIAVKVQL